MNKAENFAKNIYKSFKKIGGIYMENNFFASLKKKLEENTVGIILAVMVVVAAVLSFTTINDINQKLTEQNIQEITHTPMPAPSEEADAVVKNDENVPLPNASEKPVATPAPTQTPKEEETITEQENQEVVVDNSFSLPVEGKIITPFSGDELVYNRTLEDYRTHNGIDISSSKDNAVYAGKAGEVLNVYTDGLLGVVIEIDHGEFVARYCGLNEKTFVQKGDTVTKGQTIGSVNEVPMELSDESHLHLEILVDSVYVNPETILK